MRILKKFLWGAACLVPKLPTIHVGEGTGSPNP